MSWALDMDVSLDVCRTHPSLHSELNRMALTQWLDGIEQLEQGNHFEGRRYFKRATTLGGLYGTASNPVIQWTYAASFFPEAS